MGSAARLFLAALMSATAAQAQSMLDFHTLKRDTQVFEKIVDERLKQDFSDPFALTGDSQASYLQGYGVVVQFHLNINRGRIRTPFGEVDPPAREGRAGNSRSSADSKKQQLEKIKSILVECLANYAGAIKQLNAHDRITISAHVEDRNELDPTLRKTVLVITAARDDVDLLAMRKISDRQFRDKIQVLQY